MTFEFWPQKFFRALQSQKKFRKKILTLEGCKKILRQNFKNLFQIFIENLQGDQKTAQSIIFERNNIDKFTKICI